MLFAFVALMFAVGVVVYYTVRYPLKLLTAMGFIIGFSMVGCAVLLGVPWLIRLFTGW